MTARHCLCGASMSARSTPPDMARELAEAFDRFHSGDGHGPATAAQASRARQRAEKADALARAEALR